MNDLVEIAAKKAIRLPDQALNIIRQFRGFGDAEAWALGELSAALVDELGREHGRAAIRIAVADEWGGTASTVKDYELTARYYPPDKRDFDNLTWWHYRQARAAGDLDTSLDYLRQAVESADQYGGRPMPVRVLAAKMKTNGHTKSSTLERLLRVLDGVVRGLLTLDIPEDLRAWLEAMPGDR
jgi:hypothetical protein